MQHWGKDYWRRNVETWRDAPQPDLAAVDVHLQLDPERRHLASRGTFTLVNHGADPLRQFALTANPRWEQLTWTMNGEDYETDNRANLHVFTPASPLDPGAVVEVGFSLAGVLHPKFSKNGAQADRFVLPEGVVLHPFAPTFVPTVGFVQGIGIDEDNRADAKVWPEDFYSGITPSAFGHGGRFSVRLEVDGPERFTINGIGIKTRDEVRDGRRNVVWESDYPVDFFNVVAGEYTVTRGENTAIYHLPSHAGNVPDMLETLEAARKRYSEWFYPFPWQELKLSEFPALATYAQGFATNITFSEGIGFLARPTEEVDAPFFITAHESAHQWWGNLLVPGRGPGGNLLSEGMAHFSTILLTEAERGRAARIAFCRRIEERYGESRAADSEKILLEIDGSRPGDTTVTYDKGGWVFGMLSNLMGCEACLAGLRDFIRHYRQTEDHPVLQDFIAHMRGFADDTAAFDQFVEQWFKSVVVPRFELLNVELESSAEGPVAVTLQVRNTGSGRVRVEVAALAGRTPWETGSILPPEDRESKSTVSAAAVETAPQAGEDPFRASRVARVEIEIGPEEEVHVRIPVDSLPELVVVDPDALVLQLERKLAEHRF